MAPLAPLKDPGLALTENMLIVYPNWYMLSLGSILIYNMSIFLHNWQIHILEPINGSWASLLEPLNGSWASPDWKICINCVPMIYALTGINFDIQHADIPSQLANSHFWGPSGPSGPRLAPLKGSCAAPDWKICVYCVPMIYAFIGIDFDIQHAYVHSQLAKSHFRGPQGPFRAPLGALVKGLRVKIFKFFSICCVSIQSIQVCQLLARSVEKCGQDSQKTSNFTFQGPQGPWLRVLE